MSTQNTYIGVYYEAYLFTLVPFSLGSMHKSSHLLVNFCCKCSSAPIWWNNWCKFMSKNRNRQILSIFRYFAHFASNVTEICDLSTEEKKINCFGTSAAIRQHRWRCWTMSSFPSPLPFINILYLRFCAQFIQIDLSCLILLKVIRYSQWQLLFFSWFKSIVKRTTVKFSYELLKCNDIG